MRRLKKSQAGRRRSVYNKSMKTILIVEDDEYIGNMIEAALKNEGFATWRAYSGSEALLVFQSRPVDLVVLDLMLPGLSGEDVLSAIRTVPVVVLSAKSDLDHKVELLLQGAVDYMTKPFELKELVARVRVHLRPVDATREQTLGYHDLALVQNEARHDGQTIRLTPIETKILSALMQAHDGTMTRTALLDTLAGQDVLMSASTLKVHMSRLRAKLKTLTGTDRIEALWGIGYHLS